MGVKKVIQNIDWINHTYTNYKWRERSISYGEHNKELQIYIARRANSKAGLFSLVLTALGQIVYAVNRGYVPVVDLSNYVEGYSGSKQDTSNIWEYYFEQPCKVDLMEAKRSKRVILGNGIITANLNYPKDTIAYREKELSYWRGIARKYLIVKKDIFEEAVQLSKELFFGKKILGVLARGTDYINAKPYNHPVQPTAKQLMEKIDEMLGDGEYDGIYLATEDSIFYQQFTKKYGEKLISLKTKRYQTQGNENINDIRKADVENGYVLGKDYLITILLLSMCDALIAGNTSGTLGALLLNEEYEYKYIFDLGVYQ